MLKQDTEHLRLLSIGHYVMAAITAMLSCFSMLYVAIGLMFIFSPLPNTQNQSPVSSEVLGGIFIAFGTVATLLGWAMAFGQFVIGRSLAARRRYTLCQAVSAINCLSVPFGTPLGLFPLI